MNLWNNPFLPVLAHGSIGAWDELLGVFAFIAFVVMLIIPPVVTWVKQRSSGIPTPPAPLPNPPAEAEPSATAIAGKPKRDHYRLD